MVLITQVFARSIPTQKVPSQLTRETLEEGSTEKRSKLRTVSQ